MDRIDKALSLSNDGSNCCQAVLGAFCEEFGLKASLAHQIGSGFGGGMRRGEICGAVSGAIMALGLSENHSKDKMAELTRTYQNNFEIRHKSTRCKTLLGYDVSIPADRELIKEKGLSDSICKGLISDAVHLLEIQLNTHYHTILLEREDLTPAFDPEEVHGYCAKCHDYGKFWGCPPYDVDPLTRFSDHEKVMLVGMQIFTQGISQLDFSELYQTARRQLGLYLDEVAATYEQGEVVVAGNCYHCETCSRPDGSACKQPKKLRFSLESLGYKVGELTEAKLGLPILWPEEGVSPEYLICVGAIFIK